MYDADGRMTGFVEVAEDGTRKRTVIERDAKTKRISRMITVKSGIIPAAPGKPMHPRGGWVNRAPDDVERQMAEMHKAAWQSFVAKHGRDVIAKSYRDRAR